MIDVNQFVSSLAPPTKDWRIVNLLADFQSLQAPWDEFVDRHPKASVFHSSQMVRVFEVAQGYTPLPLAAVARDGSVLALLVATRVQTLPGMFGAVSSRSVWFAEPICSDDPRGIAALGDVIAEHDRLMRRRVLFTEVRPGFQSGAERAVLKDRDYRYLDYLNFISDTTVPKEEYWRKLSDTTRRSIRKCEKRGLELRHVNTPDTVGQLYDLLKITFAHAEVPLADRTLFEAAFEILQPHDMIEFAGIYDGERPVAIDVMLLFKKQVFSWYGGSIRMKGLSPVDWLQWHEVAWSCDHGFDRYDFGGAGWPDKPYGVRDFKAKFGGELVSYGRYRKVVAPWKMAIAERAYELGRTMLSPK